MGLSWLYWLQIWSGLASKLKLKWVSCCCEMVAPLISVFPPHVSLTVIGQMLGVAELRSSCALLCPVVNCNTVISISYWLTNGHYCPHQNWIGQVMDWISSKGFSLIIVNILKRKRQNKAHIWVSFPMKGIFPDIWHLRKKIGTLLSQNIKRMFTPHHVSHVTCQV